jgi:hypothetical protein
MNTENIFKPNVANMQETHKKINDFFIEFYNKVKNGEIKSNDEISEFLYIFNENKSLFLGGDYSNHKLEPYNILHSNIMHEKHRLGDLNSLTKTNYPGFLLRVSSDVFKDYVFDGDKSFFFGYVGGDENSKKRTIGGLKNNAGLASIIVDGGIIKTIENCHFPKNNLFCGIAATPGASLENVVDSEILCVGEDTGVVNINGKEYGIKKGEDMIYKVGSNISKATYKRSDN